MSSATLSEIIRNIVQAVIADPTRQVSGPTSKYRCKATYSLFPRLQVSSIVSDTVNALCESVQTFKEERSSFSRSHPQFFFEVMGKENRVGEMIIKLVFINEWLTRPNETSPNISCAGSPSAKKTKLEKVVEEKQKSQVNSLWEEWLASEEPKKLVEFLVLRHPSLVGVVAHVDLIPEKSKRKPTKSSNYVSLTPEIGSTITEITPNGKNYRLSVDSFCEVNHYMESEIFKYICYILDLEKGTSQVDSVRKALFLSGRDVLAMFKSLEFFYDSTECVTTCPSVFQDAELNGMSSSTRLSEKNKVYGFLRSFCHTHTDKVRHAILTSGRHGLHPSTSVELVNLATEGVLKDLIYISCNTDSLARDFHILKEGFRMHHVQVFDFFPKTPYVMSVVHWKPYTLEALRGSLLVLPIGPPGSGKSTCGKKLLDLFRVQNAQIKVKEKAYESSKPNLLVLDERILSDTSVPRYFLNVETAAHICLVERDAIFKTFKEQGCSLHASKTSTHQYILSALERPHASDRYIVYLDSTNGSEDARKLYKQRWVDFISPCVCPSITSAAYDNSDAIPTCVELFYRCKEMETLLNRVRCREGHPSFPVELDKQEEKVQNILKSLPSEGNEFLTSHMTSSTHGLDVKLTSSFCPVINDSNSTEVETVNTTLLLITSHLYLSSAMALALYQYISQHTRI